VREARLAALSVGILVSLALALAPAPAGATSVLSTTLAEMAKVSDAVVLGRVTKKAVRWSTAGDAIYTYVSVRVDSRFKGEVADDITVVVPGGTVGETTRVVHGAPRFTVGEKVVLYLEARTKGETGFNVVGMFVGKLAVKPTATGEVVEYGYPVPKVEPGDPPAVVKKKTFIHDFVSGMDLRSFVFKVRADVERAAAEAP